MNHAIPGVPALTSASASATARRAALVCIAGALLCWQSLALAVTVSDSTFADVDWTLAVFSSGSGGNVTGAQVASGGNPGSYRSVTDTLTGGGVVSVVVGVNIYQPFTYSPSTSGAINSLDWSEDAACTTTCFGSGVSAGPALLQGGNYYILCSSSVITGTSPAFANHSLSGLTAADFGLTSPGPSTGCDPSVHPNFSASGAPLKFGFLTANGTGPGGGGYSSTEGVDNWQITLQATALPPPVPVATSQPVPALDRFGMALLMLAIALLGFVYLRRSR